MTPTLARCKQTPSQEKNKWLKIVPAAIMAGIGHWRETQLHRLTQRYSCPFLHKYWVHALKNDALIPQLTCLDSSFSTSVRKEEEKECLGQLMNHKALLFVVVGGGMWSSCIKPAGIHHQWCGTVFPIKPWEPIMICIHVNTYIFSLTELI